MDTTGRYQGRPTHIEETQGKCTLHMFDINQPVWPKSHRNDTHSKGNIRFSTIAHTVSYKRHY